MKLTKTGVAVLSLAIGFVGGAIGASIVGGGAMAGIGAAAGLTTGVCTTVRAAQELDYLTAEQVDAVLAKAAQDTGGEVAPDQKTATGSAKACEAFLEGSQG